jgi:EamA domain-containing membrane protein RarD
MKKVKAIMGAVVRSALLLSPGVGFGFYAWNKATALISVMSALGLETIFLIAFSLAIVTRQVIRDKKNAADALE